MDQFGIARGGYNAGAVAVLRTVAFTVPPHELRVPALPIGRPWPAGRPLPYAAGFGQCAARTTDPEAGSPQMLLDLLDDVRFRNYSHHRVDVLAVLE